MESLWHDLKYALRVLRNAPGFTISAVLTLGLGLGASIAVFSIVNAIYFAPLPYSDVNRLVMIETSRVPSLCRPDCPTWVTTEEMSQWREQIPSLDGIAGLTHTLAVVETPSGPRRADLAGVSASFFTLLGLQPVLGRGFIPTDDRPGSEAVASLSHQYWMNNYGGDSSVIGRSLVIEKVSHRIIGVMPQSATIGRPLFRGDSLTASLFVPIGSIVAREPQTLVFAALAHLRREATSEVVRAQLDAIVAPPDSGLVRHARSLGFAPKWKTRVTLLRDLHARAYASSYGLLLGIVLLVLLIACANLAGVFLARCADRRQEVLVRAALGARRGRLVRIFVTEGLLITAAAAACSLFVARWTVSLTSLLSARAVPYWAHIGVDHRVAWFALALATVCGTTFSLFPAVVFTRDSGSLVARDSRRAVAGGRSVTRMRRVLISAEIACTLVLLTAAGLLEKALLDATAVDPRHTRRSILVGVIRDQSSEAATWTSARRLTLAEQLVGRLKVVPGVLAASTVTSSPGPAAAGITREGVGEMTPVGPGSVDMEVISPDYFLANDQALVAGRAFTDADNESTTPVGIVDEATARRTFPGGRAVGERIRLGPASANTPWISLVGVVATSPCPRTERCGYDPVVYRPMAQTGIQPAAQLTFIVRTHRPAEEFIRVIHQAVMEVDPAVVVTALSSEEWRWNQLLAPLRANASIVGAFALFALLIAALGTYGVVAYTVNQRTGEIGVRMAFGATVANVRLLMLRSAMMMVMFGVLAGAAASFALTGILRAVLYGTSPTDPRVFAVAAIALSSAALLAALLATGRATRIDPMVALRID